MVCLTNDIKKAIEKTKWYNEESFIKDCNIYIEAVKSGRVLYDVVSVSASGMSRKIIIRSFEGTMEKGFYRNYLQMLEIFGYKINKDYSITVKGCGINMLFATNYDLIGQMERLGFIDKELSDDLKQRVN